MAGVVLAGVRRQVVHNGWEIEETEPKSESGLRPVTLSDELAIELARYRERQDAAREIVGGGGVDSGRVFTAADGSGLHPGRKHKTQLMVMSWGLLRVRRQGLEPRTRGLRVRWLRHSISLTGIRLG